MGIGPGSLFIMIQDGDDLRLAPAEIVPKRRIRIVKREELAQALINGAVTPAGIEDAREGIRELGLDPDAFRPAI